MQYTSKIALLAAALFGTSALALPIAGDAEYNVEARELDNDLSTREFYEMHLEARADPSLDARDLDSVDFEAREYLDYLEARQVATVTSVPVPTQTSVSQDDNVKRNVQRQIALRAAMERFRKDHAYYLKALNETNNVDHGFAALKHLTSNTRNMKKALAKENSPYHALAKRIHHRKATAYFADKKKYKNALRNKNHKYHGDAIEVYLNNSDNFQHALADKENLHHREAVIKYLQDTKNRMVSISDPKDPFHQVAVKLQGEIDLKKSRSNKRSKRLAPASSLAPTSSTATSTPTVKSSTSSPTTTSSTATPTTIALR